MPTVVEFYEFSKLATAAYVVQDSNALAGVSIAEKSDEQRRLPAALANMTFVQNPIVNPSVWTIPEDGYYESDGTGFAATLFERGGKKVVAIRGTEFGDSDQFLKDLVLADLAGIGVLGLALAQTVSMFNWINLLRTPREGYAAQLQIRSSITDPRAMDPTLNVVSLPSGVPFQQVYLYFVSSAVEGLGVIGESEIISVTGHSLGGHLAALAARLFPSLVGEAYVYNSPGFDPVSTNLVRSLAFLLSPWLATQMGPAAAGIFPGANRRTEEFIGLFAPYVRSAFGTSPASSFDGLTIYNIESEDSAPGNDLSIVSSVITGSQILGAETFITTEGNSHLIEPLMDSLALQALIYSMNSTLSPAQIGRVLEAVSNKTADTQEKLVEALHKLFKQETVSLIHVDVEKDDPVLGPAGIGSGNIAGRRDYYRELLILEEAIRAVPAVTFSALSDLPASELAIRAGAANGLAYRYALRELNPFAILGPDSLYTDHNANGALGLFVESPTATAGMTSAYIADRARFLSWKMQINAADALNVAFSNDSRTWSFEDRTLNYGVLISRVGATTSPTPSQISRVIFGSDADSQSLLGGIDNDHLYGGAGNDLLDGKAGSDYLEGNAGDDTLIGGPGDDELRGGAGFDTYEYKTGDGFDRIIDSDGRGEIIYKERKLTGGTKVSDGLYVDEFGVQYFLFDYTEGFGSLLIGGDIHVEDYATGALGLTFGGEIEIPAVPEIVALNVYEYSAYPAGFNSSDIKEVLRVLYGSMRDDLFFVSDQLSALLGRSGSDMAILDANAYGIDIDMGAGEDYIDASGSSGVVLSGRLAGGAGNDYIRAGDGNDAIWGDNYLATHRVSSGVDFVGIDGFTYNLGPASGSGLLPTFGVFGAPFDHVSSSPEFAQANLVDLASDGAIFSGSLEDAIKYVLGSDGEFDDFIDAGGGDDFVIGGSGSDHILGGSGNDQIWGDYGGGTLDAPTYQRLADRFGALALLFGRPGDDYIDGGPGDDSIFDTDGGDDILLGGEGNDTVVSVEAYWTPADGAGAHNVIDGGAGNDVMEIHNDTGGFDVVEGGDGDDRIQIYASHYRRDTDGDGEFDLIGLTPGRAFVYGGRGNDVLIVSADEALVDGGSGDDDYTVAGRSITISDASGEDTLRLPALFDHASFDAFMETLLTQYEDAFSNQTLSAFVTQDGADLVATLSTTVDNIEVDYSQIRIRGWAENSERRIEHIVVSDGFGGEVVLTSDQFETWGGFHVGGAGPDELLNGTDYADLVFGRGGDDVIVTGAGDDRIYGGTGDDEMYGGSGNDVYYYAIADGRDIVYDVSGFDEIRFGPGLFAQDVRATKSQTGIVLSIGDGTDSIGVFGGTRSDPGVEQLRFADGSTVMVTSLLPPEAFAADPGPEDGGTVEPPGGGGAPAGTTGPEVSVAREAAAAAVAQTAETGKSPLAREIPFDQPPTLAGEGSIRASGEFISQSADTAEPQFRVADERKPRSSAPLDMQAMLDAMDEFDATGEGTAAVNGGSTSQFLRRSGEPEEDPRAAYALTSLALTNALLEFHLMQSDLYGTPDGGAAWFAAADSLIGLGMGPGASASGLTTFARRNSSLQTFAGLQEGFTRLT